MLLARRDAAVARYFGPIACDGDAESANIRLLEPEGGHLHFQLDGLPDSSSTITTDIRSGLGVPTSGDGHCR